MIPENCGSWPLKTWGDMVSKLHCISALMKIGTECKSNRLIMYMVFGTNDLDPKL